MSEPLERARVWRETVTIPTYAIGEPNANPMFLDKRVYQGSSGAVYPYPVIESVADEPSPQEWDAVYLENEYLKVMVLPQLGGRVQMALDKTNDYHFVYYNRVIKPALVGLAGPWISGGIEFNWPQHHRPNTFGPVDCWLEVSDDGVATVWCSDIDRMHGTQGVHGLTLRPGRACLEVRVTLSNPTDLPQTFLWWANTAIHVDENHQSIFPPDVYAVMDHGKRDSSSFPIARGEYYKVDYSPGTDISRYTNVPVPTSYMAYHSDYDFVGTYDHGRQAGMVHVCDHHVSPGKKQWTWGCGDFGQSWDRHLTDDDGPYIELMCGVYTDNQPDFSWLMPGEQKSFVQTFMPYKGVGRVGNATTDAVVGLHLEGGRATARGYVTSRRQDARIVLEQRGEKLIDKAFDGSPESPVEASCSIDPSVDPTELRVAVFDGRVKLVSWSPEPGHRHDVPEPARAIGPPETLDSTESLYLAGKHLQQYRHATRDPADYFREALRRDPGDVRCNCAVADLALRRGEDATAESHATVAVERATRHNPNPSDGEPHYLLGMARERLGRLDEAIAAYSKAAWTAAWRPLADVAVARVWCRKGNFSKALSHSTEALRRNGLDRRARHIRLIALRSLGRAEEEVGRTVEATGDGSFHHGVLWEAARLSGDWDGFESRTRGDEHTYLELAACYESFGLWCDAIDVLKHYLERVDRPESPLSLYRMARLHDSLGRSGQAAEFRSRAAAHHGPPRFPNGREDAAALAAASEANPQDARAPYLLGCYLYHVGRRREAIGRWESAVEIDPGMATAWRNLGLAYFNVESDQGAARAAYTRAFEANPADSRVLFELDQLAKRAGDAPIDRLAGLKQHRPLLGERDDLYLEYVSLLNRVGRHQDALDAVLDRRFHPWEGGEGRVPREYVNALIGLARARLVVGDSESAESLLDRAQDWPHSLGEGKLAGHRENDIHVLLGDAHAAWGEADAAREWWTRASEGDAQPTSAAFYNDQPPEMVFFKATALDRLGRAEEAAAIFDGLIRFGREHLEDSPTIDFFAVSLPDFLVFEDDLGMRNRAHCLHMIALGAIGRRCFRLAEESFAELEKIDPAHAGLLHRDWARQAEPAV